MNRKRTSSTLIVLIVFVMLISSQAFSADTVPYTARSIKSVGAGYVEIVGPGKIKVNEEVYPYEKIIYISINNIDSISTIDKGSKGCMLHYSSEGYTENISLVNQSCNEIIEVIKESRK